MCAIRKFARVIGACNAGSGGSAPSLPGQRGAGHRILDGWHAAQPLPAAGRRRGADRRWSVHIGAFPSAHQLRKPHELVLDLLGQCVPHILSHGPRQEERRRHGRHRKHIYIVLLRCTSILVYFDLRCTSINTHGSLLKNQYAR